jgi:HrpA-like RNA helicase
MIEESKGSECCIICTQPRRIAAISIAERVSYENGSTVGELIGYQIRLNKRAGNKTRLLFCTTGGTLTLLLEVLCDSTCRISQYVTFCFPFLLFFSVVTKVARSGFS